VHAVPIVVQAIFIQAIVTRIFLNLEPNAMSKFARSVMRIACAALNNMLRSPAEVNALAMSDVSSCPNVALHVFQVRSTGRSPVACSSYRGEGHPHAGDRDAYLLYSCNQILWARLQGLHHVRPLQM